MSCRRGPGYVSPNLATPLAPAHEGCGAELTGMAPLECEVVVAPAPNAPNRLAIVSLAISAASTSPHCQKDGGVHLGGGAREAVQAAVGEERQQRERSVIANMVATSP